jgi:hypothetical protein
LEQSLFSSRKFQNLYWLNSEQCRPWSDSVLADLCPLNIVCTVHDSVSSYFEIFPKNVFFQDMSAKKLRSYLPFRNAFQFKNWKSIPTLKWLTWTVLEKLTYGETRGITLQKWIVALSALLKCCHVLIVNMYIKLKVNYFDSFLEN